jgi:hypothetical protein
MSRKTPRHHAGRLHFRMRHMEAQYGELAGSNGAGLRA